MKMFAITITILTMIFSASAQKYLNKKILATRVTKLAPTSDTWKIAPKYELLKNIILIEDFRVLPLERATVQIAKNANTLFVKANMADSDIVIECDKPGIRMDSLGDFFSVYLMPQGQTYYWEIQCAPNKVVNCFFFPGGGLSRLPNFNIPQNLVTIECKTILDGKINDYTSKAKSWQVELAIPLDKLLAQLTAKGIKVDKKAGFKVMFGRTNVSRFLNEKELSGFPQPVRNYQCFMLYADIVEK